MHTTPACSSGARAEVIPAAALAQKPPQCATQQAFERQPSTRTAQASHQLSSTWPLPVHPLNCSLPQAVCAVSTSQQHAFVEYDHEEDAIKAAAHTYPEDDP